MFEAKVILDSYSPLTDKRLTTITATYPRFIHAEVMTHRDRARNAASSRAIPWNKMKAAVTERPVVPMYWGREQSGMQTGAEIPDYMKEFARNLWLDAGESAVRYADMLANIGRSYAEHYGSSPEIDETVKLHKSIPNRIVEPWMWITVVMTATEWSNFFRLRVHPHAEIHFQHIAELIQIEINNSEPQVCGEWDWHLPFVTRYDEGELRQAGYCQTDLCNISVARCARVSYLTHEGIREPAKDLELFQRLVEGSGFGHWSPHEHVAHPAHGRSGPFVGWKQYRKYFSQENSED